MDLWSQGPHLTRALVIAQGKLPGWIGLPKSAALPFGSFEAALDASPDKDAVRRKIAAADADPSAAKLGAVRCVASWLAHNAGPLQAFADVFSQLQGRDLSLAAVPRQDNLRAS